MIDVRQTPNFESWLAALRDVRVRSIVVARLARIEIGNFGDSRSVGGRVSELRIDFGPGYCAYYPRRGSQVVFMLGGGDKSTQARDIAKAQAMAAEISE